MSTTIDAPAATTPVVVSPGPASPGLASPGLTSPPVSPPPLDPPPFARLTHHELRTLRELAGIGGGDENRGALVGVAACNALLLNELVSLARKAADGVEHIGTKGFSTAVALDPGSTTAIATGAATLVTGGVTALFEPVRTLLQSHAADIAALKSDDAQAKTELSAHAADIAAIKTGDAQTKQELSAHAADIAAIKSADARTEQILKDHAAEIVAVRSGGMQTRRELGALEAAEDILKRHVQRLEAIEAEHRRLIALLDSIEPRIAVVESTLPNASPGSPTGPQRPPPKR